MLNDIITGYILKIHGSVVADQFMCTIEETEPFEDQNRNALVYIEESLTGIISYSDCFNDYAIENIKEYLVELKDYLYQ